MLSRAGPGGRHDDRYRSAVEEAGAVTTAAPAMFEVLYGLERRHGEFRYRRQKAWLLTEVAVGRVVVLPFAFAEAKLAASFRAAAPLPQRPARGRRSKPDDRVGWIADISIAACAWLAGSGVLTENVADFERIALAFPEERLEVVRP